MMDPKHPKAYIKALRERTKELLQQGYSRKQIIDELIPQTDKRYHKVLKAEATYLIPEEDRQKVKPLNQALIVLFVLNFSVSLIRNILYYQNNETSTISFVFLFIYLFFAYFIFKNLKNLSGGIYRVLFFIGLITTVSGLLSINVSDMLWATVIDIVTGVGLALISYKIFNQVFPNYKIFGNNTPKENSEILDF